MHSRQYTFLDYSRAGSGISLVDYYVIFAAFKVKDKTESEIMKRFLLRLGLPASDDGAVYANSYWLQMGFDEQSR